MNSIRFCKFALLLCLSAFLFSCSMDRPPSARAGDNKEESITRVNPGQAQWLEKESMLGASGDLAKVVSASHLSWVASGQGDVHSSLFPLANVWLDVSPIHLVTAGGSGAFAYLRSANFWQAMQAANIRGLYLSPVMLSGANWAGQFSELASDYDDPASFKFSDQAGSEKDYFSMLEAANKYKAIVGSSLIPSATGMGPDFFLAAKNMRQYPGAYCLVEIPQELWKELPSASSEWDTKILSKEQKQVLSGKGLFASSFVQEDLGLSGGWASTGEVRGIDGQLRRFVYRYYGNVHRPVLNWADPTAAAKRVMSGSVVRSVGQLGVALAGGSFLPLTGLAPKSSNVSGAASLEPGLGAAKEVGQEVRRYGGWSFNKDFMPLAMLRDYSNQGTDFVRDSMFSPGAEHALLTGDASMLKNSVATGKSYNIEVSRLVHIMPGLDGVNYRMNSASQAAISEVSRFSGVSGIFKNGVLSASGAAIAAIALNHTAADDLSDAARQEIQRGQEALAFFYAAQPGLLMIPAQDMVGAMPPSWLGKETFSVAPDSGGNLLMGVPLLGEKKSSSISSKGVSASPTLYQGMDIQAHTEGSFLMYIKRLTAFRDKTEIAAGKFLGMVSGSNPGVVAVVTKLPAKRGFLVAVTNFSKKSSTERLRLSGLSGGEIKGESREIFSKSGGSFSKGEVSVEIGPWGVRAILIQPPGATPLHDVGLPSDKEIAKVEKEGALAEGRGIGTPSEYAVPKTFAGEAEDAPSSDATVIKKSASNSTEEGDAIKSSNAKKGSSSEKSSTVYTTRMGAEESSTSDVKTKDNSSASGKAEGNSTGAGPVSVQESDSASGQESGQKSGSKADQKVGKKPEKNIEKEAGKKSGAGPDKGSGNAGSNSEQ